MAIGMITDDCLQNDSFQFDNFISMYTKQLLLVLFYYQIFIIKSRLIQSW